MSPTREASERQRRAAYKAWETIRRKRGELKASAKAQAMPQTRPSRKIWNASRYPADWKEIGSEIRNRSKNAYGEEQCECRGQCLKHRGRCGEINRTWARYRRSKGRIKVRFTVAHLCHTPACDDRMHLRAMCEPCHLIYDLRCRQRGLRGEDAVRWAIEQDR